MNSSTLPSRSAHATWSRHGPRFAASRRTWFTSLNRMSPACPWSRRVSRSTGRVVAAARALARVVVLRGHRRQEPVEARFAGELRMERGREDVPLADGDDPAVVEAGEDVDIGP